jgi:hypothetical protein
MVRIAAFTAAPLLLYSQSALAWGGLAHEMVCEMAFLELNDTARQRVIELIQQDLEFRSFRASCNWPDRPPRKRGAEHFVNVPRHAAELGDDECPLAENCVVTAIEDDFAVLASSDATDEEKLEALKFLGHWVGDIHQPLHVSFEDDRGGNRVGTKATSCDSLHAVWDRCLVEERIGMHPIPLAAELHLDAPESDQTCFDESEVAYHSATTADDRGAELQADQELGGLGQVGTGHRSPGGRNDIEDVRRHCPRVRSPRSSG